MVVAILTILGSILALVPLIMNARKNIKDKQNAITKTESDELGAGMDAVDRMQPPPK